MFGTDYRYHELRSGWATTRAAAERRFRHHEPNDQEITRRRPGRPTGLAAPGTLHQLPTQNQRVPPSAHLSLRRAGELPMSDLSPYGGQLRRVPRLVQQEVRQQDHSALVAARRIQNTGRLTQVALLEIGGMSGLEAEVARSAPWAARRVEALCNTAAAVMAAEVGRYGIGF